VGQQLGWRWSFYAMAGFGLALLVLFSLCVSEKRLAPERRAAQGGRSARQTFSFRGLLPGLFSARSVIFAYLGSGLQLYIVGSLIAWMPSFLNRYYGLATARASALAALFVLVSGIGMVACGSITDRLSRQRPQRKFAIAVAYSVATCVLLVAALHSPIGSMQLVLLAFGILLAGGTTGPATAMVANVTHPSIHATAFATLSLANNLLGMAPGPIVTGALADRFGLLAALQWAPFVCLVAAAMFMLGARHYERDVARLHAQPAA